MLCFNEVIGFLCIFQKESPHLVPKHKKRWDFFGKTFDFKESLHPPPSVSVHPFDSCQTAVLVRLSQHQTKKSKQADRWIFKHEHLTVRDTPDALILYFFYTADSFDAAWTRANLSEKRVRKKFFSLTNPPCQKLGCRLTACTHRTRVCYSNV